MPRPPGAPSPSWSGFGTTASSTSCALWRSIASVLVPCWPGIPLTSGRASVLNAYDPQVGGEPWRRSDRRHRPICAALLLPPGRSPRRGARPAAPWAPGPSFTRARLPASGRGDGCHGRTDRLGVKNFARLILHHRLLLACSPASDPRRHSQAELIAFRQQLRQELAGALKNHLGHVSTWTTRPRTRLSSGR